MTDDLPKDTVLASGGGAGGTQGQTASKPQTTQPVGSLNKEQLAESTLADLQEKVPVVESREAEELPEEVEGWLEKLERGEDIKLPQPIVYQGQTIVAPAEPEVDEKAIILPLTQEGVQKGIHKKIFDSARWLAEWCMRIINKFPGMVAFRQ